MITTLDELKEDIADLFPNTSGKDFVEFLNAYPDLCHYICSEEHNFFKAPASTKYHGSYPGGLVEHSYNVTKALCKLTRNNGLKWGRVISPFVVGMFHDICKIDAYKPKKSNELINSEGEVYLTLYDGYEYNYDTLYKGHGEKSLMILSGLCQLTEEEAACIRYHMGAFNDKSYEWNDYTRAIHKYPNVLWTHHADMIAAHIMEVENE